MNFRKRKSVAQRLSHQRQGRLLLFSCGLLTTLIALFLLYYPPELLRFFDYRIFDLLLSRQSSPLLEKRPVVVGIDEESLAQFGQWPWPRYRLAQLLEALEQQRVAAIGLDLLMPEEDRTSPDVILRERQRDLNESVSPGQWLQTSRNDEVLAASISTAPVVLGFKFLSQKVNVGPQNWQFEPLSEFVVRDRRGASVQLGANSLLASLPLFTAVAQRNGFTNAGADSDGVVRRLPLVLPYRGNYYPSLALATVQQALGAKETRLDIFSQEATLSWNGWQIPLGRRGNLLIGFSGQPLYQYVSAFELLRGEIPPEALAGRVVFVGATADGLGDRHVTPLDRDFPGVQIHAVVASNLLNGQWYSHPLWARGVELLCVVLLGVLSTWLLSCFNLLFPLSLLFCALIGICLGSVEVFSVGRYFISPTMPVLLLLVNAALLGLVRYGIAATHLRYRNRDLLKAQDATIVSLTTLAETRDTNTGAHILRTQRFVRTLADQLQKNSRYSSDLLEEDVEMLFWSAPLHDIGKVGIPDRILLKSGKLTDEELAVMREHPQIGAMALGCTVEALGQPENYAYLHYARQMAETHHERWDGSGYPAGLKGEEIPLAGRLMALADVYDALVSARSYKDASSHAQARDYIVSMSGQLFDPEIVTAFLKCEERFSAIALEYSDELLPEG